MVNVDPLFQDQDPGPSNSVTDGTSVVPLFGSDDTGPATPVISQSGPGALFEEEPEASPLFQPKAPPSEPNPLFAPDSPSTGAIGTKDAVGKPNPLFDPNEPAPVTGAPLEVGPAFEVPKDPLVEQTLARILQENPDKAQQERLFRGQMADLFPLDFEKLSDFAAKAIRVQQAVVSDGKRATDLHLSLCVQETLTCTMQAARDQRTPAGKSILQKLKSELESTLKVQEGPAQWYAQLHTLRGSLKLVAAELPPILESGAECLEQLTRYALILKALIPSIQDRSLNDAASRRMVLLLGAIQQIQISVKSLEQAQTLVRNEMQQVDETLTITLPALGFTL